MGKEQLIGKLESISLAPRKNAHARVRIGRNELLNLEIGDRGVIEGDDIRRCTESERYEPLAKGSDVRVDRQLTEGRRIVAWAPK